ncbi:SGNH hydrolase domain-containing protein [Cyanobium sp. Maggiore-St4-Cus]|uniref:SGNH hydrolase domain-containing protein n=1 Tax=Cyanobium sp. Maggiore-St4-Cus TaxID=2823717 RepID=UPI00396565D1
MLLIASGSYKWIEQPSRRSISGGRFLTLSGGGICLLLAGFTVQKALASFKDILYRGDRDEFYMSSNPAYNGKLPGQQSKQSNARNIIVLGNSHAGHLLPLVKEVADKNSWSYKVFATPSKSIPTINGNWIRVGETSEIQPDKETPVTNQRVKATEIHVARTSLGDEAIRAIRELRSGDLLLLSSRHFPMYQKLFVHNHYRYYLDARGESNQILNRRMLITAWKDKLQEIIKRAVEKGAVVIFFAPLPEFQTELQASAICSREWFRLAGETPSHCRLLEAREPMLRKRFFPEMEISLKQLEAQFPNFHIFDSFSAMCPPATKFCDSSSNMGRLYSDNDHLSVRGALHLAKAFEMFLARHSLAGT